MVDDKSQTTKDVILRFFGTQPSPRTRIWLISTAGAALVLETIRLILQERYPELRHPATPSAPEWVHLFYVAQMILFAVSSIAAFSNISNAIGTQNTKNLSLLGLLLYAAWWIEIVAMH